MVGPYFSRALQWLNSIILRRKFMNDREMTIPSQNDEKNPPSVDFRTLYCKFMFYCKRSFSHRGSHVYVVEYCC